MDNYSEMRKNDLLDLFAQNSNEYRLSVKSLSMLYDEVYKPKNAVIDGLLYSGTYLFVGAPKVGKSFFMSQLAFHVSSGTDLWSYKVHKGTVLYLSLEDGYARLQHRLYTMFGEKTNDKLCLSVQSNKLDDGLEKLLENFIEEHTDTKLIIIDTLQKIREMSGEKYSYANDYEIVNKLKKFSDSFNICLLIVHHTRKQQSEDCFETISGTELLGAADGAFVLQKEKRIAKNAILDIVGRDQEDQKLYLEFDKECCLWKMLKAEHEKRERPKDELLDIISKVVTADAPEWSGTATALKEKFGIDITPNALTRYLNVNVDRLLNEYKIMYTNQRTHEGRTVIFKLISEA